MKWILMFSFLGLPVLAAYRSVPQTVVVFQDHEVPFFVVVEKNGKKQVVIDRSNLKSPVNN